ncbi:MAG: hypothetical protein LAT67_01085 [Balneolales bacterium]|nr:hypothetical protein [Balneolales bacterium]
MNYFIGTPVGSSLALIGLFMLFTGCLSHTPMSEIKMFHEKRGSDGTTSHNIYAHGIASLSGALTSEFSHNEENIFKANQLQTHFIYMGTPESHTAYSIAIGSGFGVDMTTQMFPRYSDNYYLTASLSGLRNASFQIIPQRRILDGNPIGLAIGMNY